MARSSRLVAILALAPLLPFCGGHMAAAQPAAPPAGGTGLMQFFGPVTDPDKARELQEGLRPEAHPSPGAVIEAAKPDPLSGSLWVLDSTRVSDDCQLPVIANFTTIDGRAIEASRLEVSTLSATWTQRAFFSDGAPMFESEMSVWTTSPDEIIRREGSLRVIGQFVNRQWVQGAGGAMTYDVIADGAALSSAEGQVVLNWDRRDDDRTYTIKPTRRDGTFSVSLRVWSSPCMITWTWRWDWPPTDIADGGPSSTPDDSRDGDEACGDRSKAFGWVRPIAGRVEVYDPLFRKWKHLYGGRLPLYQCMIVRTGVGGQADVFAFGDGLILAFENTILDLRLVKDEPVPGVGLIEGFIHGSRSIIQSLLGAAPSADEISPYNVHTATIVTAVRGTDYILINDTQARTEAVLLRQGEVEVRGNGRAETLSAGQMVRADGGALGAVRTMPPEVWQRAVAAKSGAEIAEAIGEGPPSASPTAKVVAPAAVAALSPEPIAEAAPVKPPAVAQAASAPPAAPGSSAADPRAEVNLLIVEARKAFDRASGLAGADRNAALSEALDRLNRIIDDYPGSDHAVTLIGGGAVAGLSIPLIEQALAGNEPTADAAAVTPAPAATVAPAVKLPAAAAHALTVPVSLLRQAQETAVGRFRLGVRYLTNMRPFASTFGLPAAQGALVAAVTADSPAEAAGILPGDLIVRLGGRAVGPSAPLNRIIDETPSTIAIDAELIRVGAGPDDLMAKLREAAARDDAAALTALGELASQGFGGEPDQVEAARLYRRAADLGGASAAQRLGALYLEGRGVTADYAEATRWFLVAADGGEADAKASLGRMYWNGQYWNGTAAVRDDDEAVRLFRAAAEAGVADGYLYLGIAYHVGRGTAADHAEARRWYEKAIDAGSTAAMHNLGQIYLSATGAAKDVAEALRLFGGAAAAGNADAQRQLGFLYRDGADVAADKPRAAEYFRQAATAGSSSAAYALAAMLFNGNGVAVNASEAVDWFGKASAAGDGDADYALAVAYLNGKGVARDPDRAAAYLFAAIGRGNTASVEQMKSNSGGWPEATRAGLQERLKQRGLYAGKVDGKIGPGTLRAIDALAATAGKS